MIHRLPRKPKAGLSQFNRQLAQSETVMRQIREAVNKAESARTVEQIKSAAAPHCPTASK